jgi:DNA mismatch repair protein MutS2
VHGHSGSGQTVFLEPLQAVERNNAIAEMEAEEQQERVEILRELSGRLRDRSEEIERGYSACGELDCLRARARLALDLDCRTPAFNDGDRLRIVAGRHPLLAETQRLGGVRVVPLDIELTGVGTTLVLSGPNMGQDGRP